MCKSFLTLFLTIICLQVYAQQPSGDTTRLFKKSKKSKIITPPFSYIGFSGGINNPGGMGFDFDIPIKKYISIGTGLGFSTWGNKLHLEGKYYLKPHQSGWALAGGICFNSGVDNKGAKLETYNGKERVSLNLHPVGAVFLGVYKYWSLGKRYNRFFIDMGWNVPLRQPRYYEISGDPLNDKGKASMQRREPGGPMIGLGFSFGLHH